MIPLETARRVYLAWLIRHFAKGDGRVDRSPLDGEHRTILSSIECERQGWKRIPRFVGRGIRRDWVMSNQIRILT